MFYGLLNNCETEKFLLKTRHKSSLKHDVKVEDMPITYDIGKDSQPI